MIRATAIEGAGGGAIPPPHHRWPGLAQRGEVDISVEVGERPTGVFPGMGKLP